MHNLKRWLKKIRWQSEKSKLEKDKMQLNRTTLLTPAVEHAHPIMALQTLSTYGRSDSWICLNARAAWVLLDANISEYRSRLASQSFTQSYWVIFIIFRKNNYEERIYLISVLLIKVGYLSSLCYNKTVTIHTFNTRTN